MTSESVVYGKFSYCTTALSMMVCDWRAGEWGRGLLPAVPGAPFEGSLAQLGSMCSWMQCWEPHLLLQSQPSWPHGAHACGWVQGMYVGGSEICRQSTG